MKTLISEMTNHFSQNLIVTSNLAKIDQYYDYSLKIIMKIILFFNNCKNLLRVKFAHAFEYELRIIIPAGVIGFSEIIIINYSNLSISFLYIF